MDFPFSLGDGPLLTLRGTMMPAPAPEPFPTDGAFFPLDMSDEDRLAYGAGVSIAAQIQAANVLRLLPPSFLQIFIELGQEIFSGD